MREQENNKIAHIWLNQISERYCPPEEELLRVEVIGDSICLSIARYNESGMSEIYEIISEVTVDLSTFLKAIFTSGDKKKLVLDLDL